MLVFFNAVLELLYIDLNAKFSIGLKFHDIAIMNIKIRIIVVSVLITLFYTLSLSLMIILAGGWRENIWYFFMFPVFVSGGIINVVAVTGYFEKKIKNPLTSILGTASKAAVGDLSTKSKVKADGEISELSHSINNIIENQLSAAEFAYQIGDGELEVDFGERSENDKLGHALIRMQNKLRTVASEDKKRTWANEGYAKFSELLRNNSDNIQTLTKELLNNLIKYLDVNQGAIFLIEENETGDSVLKLKSAYAWGRKKYMDKEIKAGEGLLGQAFQEKDTIYITDIPDDFIRIGSGLGDAKPTSVLIVPLKYSEEIHGVIEFASFHEIEAYQVEFVEKLAESIASSISSVQVNERTKILLRESQLLTEQMRTQEEELRQNTEELQATQENIAQNLEKIKAEKEKNMAILEGCVDAVVGFAEDGEVEFFNKAAEEIWKMNRKDVLGKNIKEIMPLDVRLRDGMVIAEFDNEGSKTFVDVRTEVSVYDSEKEEVPVLMTLSSASVGNNYYFTVFVQSIAVELF